MISTVNNFSFKYEIIRKPKIKNLYIRIKSDKVIVSANRRVSDEYIENFVKSKSSWIHKHLSKPKENRLLGNTQTYIYLLGHKYLVRIDIDSSNRKPELKLETGQAVFKLPNTMEHKELLGIRDMHYRSLCSVCITPLVEKYADIMNLYPSKISYRNNKSRWGSCSSKNSISLNSRLMMLSKEMISYVVIHELAHIKHKNHSSEFWKEVERYCPDYKNTRASIRKFESYL